MAPNGMGMRGPSGMGGHNTGIWFDTSMDGWGEEPGQRTRGLSYGGDDGASEYGYGEVNHEKRARSSIPSWEKVHEWSGNSDRRYRDEREHNWERSERDHKDHRYREEKEGYRDHRKREHDSGYDDDWERGQSSLRSKSRCHAVPEENYRSRSRDVDYGKKRCLPSERHLGCQGRTNIYLHSGSSPARCCRAHAICLLTALI